MYMMIFSSCLQVCSYLALLSLIFLPIQVFNFFVKMKFLQIFLVIFSYQMFVSAQYMICPHLWTLMV